MRIARIGLVLAALLPAALPVRSDEEPTRRLNPFADPFLPATSGRPCPAPRGPAYDEAEFRVEAHSRAERGTTCWLQGLCSEPNAYRYDPANAEAAIAALRADGALSSSAIWVTAQRRFVYLEGCVADVAQAVRAERAVQAVAGVERVIPALALPGERAPYAVAGASRPR